VLSSVIVPVTFVAPTWNRPSEAFVVLKPAVASR
jgi:hypothetical protein